MKKALFLLAALSIIGCTQPAEVSDELLITNVTVIDVQTGAKLSNRHVAISGDRISKIYEGEVTPSDSTEVVDGTGKFLIPGLSDMHTHYFWNYTFSSPLLIANGITHIREMWGEMNTIKMVRQLSVSGGILAPDIYSAGSIIDGTPPVWPTSTGVATIEEAIKAVDDQIESGVDFLKVYSRLPKDIYMAIADHAKSKGVPFAGHIPSSVTTWEAMEAGQQSTEHFYGMLEASTNDPAGLEVVYTKNPFSMETSNFLVDHFDRTMFDSLATVMAASDTWFSPTLVVLRAIANLGNDEFRDDHRMEYLPGFMTQSWDPTQDFRFKNRPAGFFEASKKKFQLQLSLMKQLSESGVKIIAGTDYPNPYCFPGFSLHDELELMVEGGMTSLEALKAATLNAAIFTNKLEEFGTVDEGKLANLVLLQADPLSDINNTRKIEAVILRGKHLDRAKLDELLESAKKMAGN